MKQMLLALIFLLSGYALAETYERHDFAARFRVEASENLFVGGVLYIPPRTREERARQPEYKVDPAALAAFEQQIANRVREARSLCEAVPAVTEILNSNPLINPLPGSGPNAAQAYPLDMELAYSDSEDGRTRRCFIMRRTRFGGEPRALRCAELCTLTAEEQIQCSYPPELGMMSMPRGQWQNFGVLPERVDRCPLPRPYLGLRGTRAGAALPETTSGTPEATDATPVNSGSSGQ